MSPSHQGLQSDAEAAHSRHPGVRQARSAKLVACRGFQSSKASVAAQRTLIAPEALYGRIEDNLQCSIFAGRLSKVRQHTLLQRHHSQPEPIACRLCDYAGQAQKEGRHHQCQLLASCRLHCKCFCFLNYRVDGLAAILCNPDLRQYLVSSAMVDVFPKHACVAWSHLLTSQHTLLQSVAWAHSFLTSSGTLTRAAFHAHATAVKHCCLDVILLDMFCNSGGCRPLQLTFIPSICVPRLLSTFLPVFSVLVGPS